MREGRASALEAWQFARSEFQGAALDDQRLGARLVRIAYDLGRNPHQSLPTACGGWASTKAAYRFFSNRKVRREKVQQVHMEATAQRIAKEAEVLVVQDTTTLNFSHHPATQGLGKIGSRKWPNQLQGALVHSSLAVRVGTHEVLGLLDQETWIREEYRPAEETKEQRQRRARESQKWMKSARQALTRLGDPAKAIFVFDREGDLWEVLEGLPALGARYVVRAARNRRVEEPSDYLFDQVNQAPVKARRELVVPARGGRRKRIASLALRAETCVVRAPKRIAGGPTANVHVVSVKEEGPPARVEPVEWMLLTSEPIGSEDEIVRILEHYSGRWKIEEWHKVLKSGCRMEARELESWEALEALLGVFSVIAWRLLALRDVVRAKSKSDGPEILTEIEGVILRALNPKLKTNDSTADYVRAVAKLGGFLDRKADGSPGWITIWRGLSRLQEMEVGYQLAKQDK